MVLYTFNFADVSFSFLIYFATWRTVPRAGLESKQCANLSSKIQRSSGRPHNFSDIVSYNFIPLAFMLVVFYPQVQRSYDTFRIAAVKLQRSLMNLIAFGQISPAHYLKADRFKQFKGLQTTVIFAVNVTSVPVSKFCATGWVDIRTRCLWVL